MPRYIAFLRAINVGGHTVKMDQLRSLFEEMGFDNVTTFIASGNVIFETRATKTATLEKKIEQHLHEALGYEVGTLIRTAAELAAVADYQPFATVKPEWTMHVMFFRDPLPAEARKALLALATAGDEFHVNEREAYWLRHGKLSESPLFAGTLLNKALGKAVTTMRNMNTVRKMAAKYSEEK